MNEYSLFQSGHVTYLRVTRSELDQLKPVPLISAFSRIDSRWAYLDCEVDVLMFLHHKLGHPLLTGEFTSEQIYEQKRFLDQCGEVIVDDTLSALPSYSIMLPREP